MRMRNRYLVGIVVLATVASMSGSLAASPNPTSGRHLAAGCAACHGSDGLSVDNSIPNIAGQHYVYLVQQLADFKSGARVSPLMTEFARPLSDQQIADLAAYYASMPIVVGKPSNSTK
jgi:cytochrome c553